MLRHEAEWDASYCIYMTCKDLNPRTASKSYLISKSLTLGFVLISTGISTAGHRLKSRISLLNWASVIGQICGLGGASGAGPGTDYLK